MAPEENQLLSRRSCEEVFKNGNQLPTMNVVPGISRRRLPGRSSDWHWLWPPNHRNWQTCARC